MKTYLILTASLLAGASLILLPIADGYTFRGELSGFLSLMKSAIECPCGPSCQCESCDCILCNEMNARKTRGK